MSNRFERARNAMTVSREVSVRLSSLPACKEIAAAPDNLSPSRGTPPWNDGALADGYPGLAVLFDAWRREEPDEGWDQKIHACMLAMQASGSLLLPQLSLFTGITGVAYAVWLASERKKNYRTLLAQLNDFIVRGVRESMHEAATRWELETGYPAEWFDVINGISGVGRYLLANREEPENLELLGSILRYLISLAGYGKYKGRLLPRWHVQPAHLSDFDRDLYPEGYHQTGLSHGIAGPLTLLSQSLQAGVEVEGHREAIEFLATWLIKRLCKDDRGVYWPPLLAGDPKGNGQNPWMARGLEGWCHGTPGTALALLQAASACDNDQWRDAAMLAFSSVCELAEDDLARISPTFCHGQAGLLHMAGRIAEISGDDKARVFADSLADKLIASFDPDLPFGYTDWEGDYRIHHAGLLQGAGGIALSLLAYGAFLEGRENREWDQLFLLS